MVDSVYTDVCYTSDSGVIYGSVGTRCITVDNTSDVYYYPKILPNMSRVILLLVILSPAVLWLWTLLRIIQEM